MPMKVFILLCCLCVGANTFAQHTNNIYQEFEVAQNAEFPEGIENFKKLIYQNIQYPAQKKKTVAVVSFLVNEQGKVEQVKALKKAGDGYDEATIKAIMIVNSKYTWKPALNSNGQIVKVRKTIPIKFE
ncbi:hypothetical protein AD998_17665 [bacterium 336/3]|nr:hypothetical protein AD998_17665 [bacterium 336/3]